MALLRSISGQRGERLDVRGRISLSLEFMILYCGVVRVFDHECCCSGDDIVDDVVIRNRIVMYDWIKEIYIGSSWRSDNDRSP